MSARFTVLASSSSGNASLLDVAGRGILIDFGLGPRKIQSLLEDLGHSWAGVRDVLLTHVHGDHWRDLVLRRMLKSEMTLWCHAEHAGFLRNESSAFLDLEEAERVRLFEAGTPFECGACRVTAFALWHDTFTCGFRFEGIETGWSLGYASDLGAWTDQVIEHLSDVDLLALEFNHDVAMQEASGRSPWLIRRNLSRDGHLSNAQAAKLLGEIVKRSGAGRLRHLVPLHLSQDCNCPDMVVASATAVRKRHGADFAIVPAEADRPLGWINLEGRREVQPSTGKVKKAQQALFDGWE
jgi:phosphoribosyl 1,2-cyclic phosphodiesterase